MFSRLVFALALFGATFSSPTEQLEARQATTPPAGYYPVYIATSKSDKFVLEPQTPVKAGSAILLAPLTNATTQTWLMTKGTNGGTKLLLTGTDLCMDAGTGRSNGSPITVTKCADALVSQNWEWTKEDFLVIASTKICADLYMGTVNKGTKIVLWGCIAGDKNHIWKAINATTTPTTPTP